MIHQRNNLMKKLKLSKAELEAITNKLLNTCYEVACRYSDITIDYTEFTTIVLERIKSNRKEK